MTNEYDGSVDFSSTVHVSGGTGITVSGIPEEMWENGWRSYNHSDSGKTIWQLRKDLPNGRHHEIRLDNHDKKEGLHIHMKYMLPPNEKPTKNQFLRHIAPQLKEKVKGVLKKQKNSSDKE